MKRKYSESSGYQSGKRLKLSLDRDNHSKRTVRSQVIPNPVLSQSLKLCGTREIKQFNNRKRRSKHRVKIDEAPEIGTVIEQRYRIDKFLGKGSFGFVCACTDLRVSRLNVAIKFLKYLDEDRATVREVAILRRLAEADVSGAYHCIQPVDLFKDTSSRMDCLVFPLYACNVYEWLKQNNYRPFSLSEARTIMAQVCRALAFIHSLNIVHTDIKPENIMIVDDTSTYRSNHDRLRNLSIKIIDFGMSVEGNLHRHHCQTRHYRAPEVLLEQEWSFGIDIWSAGCILYELITGDTIFMPSNVYEHLFLIRQFLGKISLSFVNECSHDIRTTYFHKNGSLRKIKFDCDITPLRQLSKYRKYDAVLDLIRHMMSVNRFRRISARDSLAHDFFRE